MCVGLPVCVCVLYAACFRRLTKTFPRLVYFCRCSRVHRFVKLHEAFHHQGIARFLPVWESVSQCISRQGPIAPTRMNLLQTLLRYANAGRGIVRCINYCNAERVLPPATIYDHLENTFFHLGKFASNTARGIGQWRQQQQQQQKRQHDQQPRNEVQLRVNAAVGGQSTPTFVAFVTVFTLC